MKHVRKLYVDQVCTFPLRAAYAVKDIEHLAEPAYRIGFTPLLSRILGGTS